MTTGRISAPPAEARLAGRLAEGLTPHESAQAEGLTRETVRSRVEVLFAKTGTGRQAELAVLLARVASA